MKKNIPNARQRILEAAVSVFADKSFEGSRVDQIAEKAGVPKSLIYYHFKNKDEILQVLIDDLLEKVKEQSMIAKDDSHQSKLEALPERMGSGQSNIYEKYADLIRIVFIESLKKSEKKPRMFDVAETLIDAEESFDISKKNENYDRQERLVAEFFTNIIPSTAYLCFKDAWSDFFNIDKKTLDAYFYKVFIATHGAYHRDHG